MSHPPLPVERYETELFGGGRSDVSLRGLPPGEPVRLGPLFAAIDPWARLGYKSEALAAYLGTIEKSAPRYAIMVGVLTVLLSALTVWRKGYFRMQGLCSPVVEKGLHASNSTQDTSD